MEEAKESKTVTARAGGIRPLRPGSRSLSLTVGTLLVVVSGLSGAVAVYFWFPARSPVGQGWSADGIYESVGASDVILVVSILVGATMTAVSAALFAFGLLFRPPSVGSLPTRTIVWSALIATAVVLLSVALNEQDLCSTALACRNK